MHRFIISGGCYAFNTPLEMPTNSTVIQDFPGIEVLSILHWRCLRAAGVRRSRRVYLSILHWRCNSGCTPTIPTLCLRLTFNTPLEMLFKYEGEPDLATLKRLHFQYSIGDAMAIGAAAAWFRKTAFNTPLEMLAYGERSVWLIDTLTFQYSIGDAATAQFGGGYRHVRSTFNTPLEMQDAMRGWDRLREEAVFQYSIGDAPAVCRV